MECRVHRLSTYNRVIVHVISRLYRLSPLHYLQGYRPVNPRTQERRLRHNAITCSVSNLSVVMGTRTGSSLPARKIGETANVQDRNSVR